MPENRPPLSLVTLEDYSGNTLEGAFQKALAKIEEFLSEHFANHADAPDKPAKITMTVEVQAQGPLTRAITFETKTDLPRVPERRVLVAFVDSGNLVVEPPRQPRLPHVTTLADLKTGDDEE